MTTTKQQTKDLKQTKRWAEGAVVYQIYPRSFQDSNGDGIGDLQGITSRLDYVKELGVNALWLSPIYPSPMTDFGYDISDYCGIHEIFGTIEDFKNLLVEAHKRDIRIMLDLVPNHTSIKHPWFQESMKSKDNPKADWYIWRDAKEGSTPEDRKVPNNWLDVFIGETVWEWSETRQQYYMHSFHIDQPDLNFNNPEVRNAIKDVIRYWLDMGVDGFRVDAVYWLAKDLELRDERPNPNYNPDSMKWNSLIHDMSSGSPELWTYLNDLGSVFREPQFIQDHKFMVVEAYPDYRESIPAYMDFYKGLDPEIVAPFNFEGIKLPWNSFAWRNFLRDFHSALESYSNLCVASYAFGNHDHPRLVTRLGDAAARSVAVMLLTLPGMIFVYYGEELGMKNVHIPPECSQDPAAKAGGHGEKGQGRDPQRTPMLWNKEKNAGFSTSDKTWLPVTPDYKECCVEVQKGDPGSFYTLYNSLILLRQSHDALKYGSMEVLDTNDEDVLAYVRPKRSEDIGVHYVIVRNFGDHPKTYDPHYGDLKCILSSDPKSENVGKHIEGKINLHAYEAIVLTRKTSGQDKAE